MLDEQEKTLRGFLTRHVTAVDVGAGLLIVLLTMTAVFFGLQAGQTQEELFNLSQRENTKEVNKETLVFTQLFIEKVLKAEGEIDFETRLNLESSVRALKDPEILMAWQAFTGSTTEKDAQTAVKNLLGVLVAKIR